MLPAGTLGCDGTTSGHGAWAADTSSLDDILAPPAWHDAASCRHFPELSWFPERGEPLDTIRAICQACPVVDACRAWALSAGPTLAGVWAGLSERDRQRLRKAG